ncbi:hypothetical protein GTQ99_00345 [Kineococcus sp. T13]|uniref:hypothetical protein n=1 Tax=Kineococcus vitellinus TaxID=2696565 RepID=UPI001411D753|nr:hypothetical protein [Kineococcus vitellinus]NAZ73880.1 hypothetical protein [Kineococcus vitellinus]
MAADILSPELTEERQAIEQDYETWLATMFAGYAKYDLAEHHHTIWRWLWAIGIDDRPASMVAILARGAAKSTTAELGVVALGVRQTRRYVVYVCETQDQADKHVATIGAMLESSTVEEHYPEMGERLVGKFGNAKGWRRNRLRTSTGFTVDALGLDTAARGIRVEDQRPDLIVLDDIDEASDTPRTTAKKIDIITKGIIPAGSTNVAVLAVQNLIHADSIFARLADGRADFLRRRTVIGPIPGLRDFAFDMRTDGTYRITSGDPTWDGGSIETYEALLNDIGPRAFMTEVQHEVNTVEGAIATADELDAIRVSEGPDLQFSTVRSLVMIDPAVSNSPSSDETGMQVLRLGTDGLVYQLADLSCRLPIDDWADRAVAAAVTFSASVIGYENNQGYDAIRSALQHALDRAGVTDVVIREVHAGKSRTVSKAKFDRAMSLQEAIRQKTIRFVGHFPQLEQQIKTTTADIIGPSPDRLDALVHGRNMITAGFGQTVNVETHKRKTIMGDLLDRKW